MQWAPIRSVVEQVSRNRVLKRRLPKKFGSREVFVSPDSALQFWKRDLSGVAPELFALADKLVRPGAIVWDVGANVGLFSFAAAAKAGSEGKVCAIEADPWLAMLLRRSAEVPYYRAAPVEVLNVAVSDCVSILEFNIAKRGRSSNFVSGFSGTQSDGARTVFPVIAISLDWLAERSTVPTVVKIDVETMDHLVLRGATKMLRSRPILIAEVTRQRSVEVSQLLTEYGYKLLTTDLETIATIPHTLPANIVAMPA
jgi:FkbM family methyltransferase